MVDNVLLEEMRREVTATADAQVADLKAVYGDNLFVSDGTNVGLNVSAFSALADAVHFSVAIAAASGDQSYLNEVASKVVFTLNAVADEGKKFANG